MIDELSESLLRGLTPIQCEAVERAQGAVLVVAGPGSGKTEVLTRRIARILGTSPKRKFRVLALTFTNKAAAAMRARLSGLVPGMESRAEVETFHSFCTGVLRQHGAHLGIKPDFAIFSRGEDRQAVLDEALAAEPDVRASCGRVRLIPLIDYLKAELVSPERAESHLATMKGASTVDCASLARAYGLYEEGLREANALDYNSLILEAHGLFGHAALARHYQTMYPYWLIDEFQDTNRAQYELIRRMAAGGFRELFAVADDDQTVFEWNGADISRITALVSEFKCDVIQLPDNFRCPPRIVEAANRLVVYNTRRVGWKRPAVAARGEDAFAKEPIRLVEFATDGAEAAGVAQEIGRLSPEERGATAALARNRALLEAVHQALEGRGVPSTVRVRRDDFLSPHMRWLVAYLRQVARPLSKRNMESLVRAFDRLAHIRTDWKRLVSRSDAEGAALLSLWGELVGQETLSEPVGRAVCAMQSVALGRSNLRKGIEKALESLESMEANGDLRDDLSAWRRIAREIRAEKGWSSLDRFLQQLDLRSKEPVPEPGSVSLMTIHGAKGHQFDTVYVMGLAEEVLPSWQSVARGEEGSSLEEERRLCFVAVTRTKKRLVLSRARSYRGWSKEPSRFLMEMGCFGRE